MLLLLLSVLHARVCRYSPRSGSRKARLASRALFSSLLTCQKLSLYKWSPPSRSSSSCRTLNVVQSIAEWALEDQRLCSSHFQTASEPRSTFIQFLVVVFPVLLPYNLAGIWVYYISNRACMDCEAYIYEQCNAMQLSGLFVRFVRNLRHLATSRLRQYEGFQVRRIVYKCNSMLYRYDVLSRLGCISNLHPRTPLNQPGPICKEQVHTISIHQHNNSSRKTTAPTLGKS